MALIGDDEGRGKTVTLPSLRGFQRLHSIASDVAQTLQVWRPTFVAIEGYAYVRNVGAFVTLVEIGTVIRQAMYAQQLPWVEVPPTVLKKWTTGSGIATKDQMALSVRQRWSYQSHSHDIVDAFALAQMAQLGWAEVLAIKGVTIGWAQPPLSG
jgi:Holliday junction resolvasome RuvABC endonuclease subunit